MRRLAILSVILSAGCGGNPPSETESFELENGLKVILRPVPSASHAALVVLFDIGGDHDPPGQSGLAHTVEHVYVTAAAGDTKSRTVQDYVAAYPLGWNAQTGDRYTVVATVFDAQALDEELKAAADRMGGLRVTDADLDREKPRIIEELHNMYGGLPQLAANNLAREMIRPSAAGHRKGGVIDHVSKLGAPDVHAWWEKYYKPNNATLVLAGRFDAIDAKHKIRNRFSSIESGDPPPETVPPAEAIVTQPMQVRVEPTNRAARPRVCLAYAAPAPSEDLFGAFLVMVAKMQSRAAELQSDPQQFPVQFMAIDDPSVLYVTSDVRDGETAEQTIERLDAFVLQIANEAVSKADRELTKNSFAFFYETSHLPDAVVAGNVYGLAFGLGRREQLGITPKQLADSIVGVHQEAYDRCREQVFDIGRRAAVVVIPE